MNVILSRKGFDSANGGIASPVFGCKTMVSLPIPMHDKDTYEELHYGTWSYKKILDDLGYRDRKKTNYHCHVDPDLDRERRKCSEYYSVWKPAFGQIGSAQGYLDHTVQVKPGDLFLFFGTFRHVEETPEGKLRYVRRRADTEDPYIGKTFQAVWGYMVIGRILRNTNPNEREEMRKYVWHPHHDTEHLSQTYKKYQNNTLYLPEGDKYGILEYPRVCLENPDWNARILTHPDRTKAEWIKRAAYDEKSVISPEGKRRNRSKYEDGIFYPGIWQEIGLKNADEWVEKLGICL